VLLDASTQPCIAFKSQNTFPTGSIISSSVGTTNHLFFLSLNLINLIDLFQSPTPNISHLLTTLTL